MISIDGGVLKHVCKCPIRVGSSPHDSHYDDGTRKSKQMLRSYRVETQDVGELGHTVLYMYVAQRAKKWRMCT